MLCRVLNPFIDKVTGVLYKADEKIELTAERLAEVQAVGLDLVEVIPVTETKTKTRTKKATKN